MAVVQAFAQAFAFNVAQTVEYLGCRGQNDCVRAKAVPRAAAAYGRQLKILPNGEQF